MDLSKGYLLPKILLYVLLSNLGLLELSYGTSGPKFYIYNNNNNLHSLHKNMYIKHIDI